MNVAFLVTAHIIEFLDKQWNQYQTSSRNDSIDEIPPHLIDDVVNSSYTDPNKRDSKSSK